MVSSKLIDGLVPSYQDCPWKKGCGFEKEGLCGHKGEHQTEHYRCGMAEIYDKIGFDPDTCEPFTFTLSGGVGK